MNSDEKRGIERFRRVKEEEVEIDNRVVDNSFEAKVSVLESFFLMTKKKMRKVEKSLDTNSIVGARGVDIFLQRTLNCFYHPIIFHLLVY
jgi:hypothetical protein